MPPDFPALARSVLGGLAGGAVVVAGTMLWRRFHGQPLFPKRQRSGVADVPFSVWLLGTLFFGAAAFGSALASLTSFTLAFSVLTLVYLGGLAYNRLR